MSPPTILSTGSKPRIGFPILQAVATPSSNDPYLLAVRNIASGKEAAQELRKLGL